MKLASLKPDLRNGMRWTCRPWRWLYTALILVALVLVTSLGAQRGYVLGECARQKLTQQPVKDAYSQNYIYKWEKQLGRLGGDGDDDDDDDDSGSA